MPKSSHVANRANGPPYAQSVMSMDSDDGISYKGCSLFTLLCLHLKSLVKFENEISKEPCWESCFCVRV